MRLLSKGSHSSTVLNLVRASGRYSACSNCVALMQSPIHTPNESSHPYTRLIVASLPPTPWQIPLLHSWRLGSFSPFSLIFAPRECIVSNRGNKVTTPRELWLAQLLRDGLSKPSCVVVVVVFVVVVVVAVMQSLCLLFCCYFHPWKCNLPSVFTRILMCPLGTTGTNPRLLWQSQ